MAKPSMGLSWAVPLGVCMDLCPGEGKKSGAGERPGDAQGLPQRLLRSRPREVGNGSWMC